MSAIFTANERLAICFTLNLNQGLVNIQSKNKLKVFI